jgi:hypothetical protein
LSRTAAVLKEF